MEEKSKKVIIKRVKKNHGGGHGGSWKVAYADFVTAMMAFFLLMWLLAMVSPDKQAKMANYFRTFSLFDKPGKSFTVGSDVKPLVKSPGEQGKAGSDQSEQGSHPVSAGAQDQLLAAIKEEVKSLDDDFRESVTLSASPDGVRLQIFDLAGKPLFEPGTANFTERGRSILRTAALLVGKLSNDFAIEGHTGAAEGKKAQMDTWQLSSLRAANTMKEFLAAGVPAGRVAKIEGFAGTVPLIKDNPADPRNGRISIILLNTKRQPPETRLKPSF